MAVLSKADARLIDLSRDRQILTRFQEIRIRQTFPYLSLPVELRYIIYDLCINFNGVDTFFEKYYNRIKKTRRPEKVKPPKLHRAPPNILLANRQIYAEASRLLAKKEVTFNHGLLDIGSVTEVVASYALQDVGQITVSTRGHALCQQNILRESWGGYMDLVSQLAGILAKGHSLKKLVLDFSDQDLVMHVTKCWDANNRCDFRDQIREAFDRLRRVRAVGCVVIIGLPPPFAQELKSLMESRRTSILHLPRELRNMIYKLSASYDDINIAVQRTMDNWIDKKSTKPHYPKRTTPTVLLINRQIYSEASLLLLRQTLALTVPRNHSMQEHNEVPNLLKFITRSTLQQIRHLAIRIDQWEWLFALERLFSAFTCQTKPHNLKTFHFYFKDSLKDRFLADRSKKYPDATLHISLSALAGFKGVESVVFEGDLPRVYTDALRRSMMSKWEDAEQRLILKAVRGDGEVVDADEEETQ